MTRAERQFVICIRNKGYSASLEIRKLYQTVPDQAAANHQQVRVIDESGEDYLYPATYFIPVKLPQSAEKAVRLATSLTAAK